MLVWWCEGGGLTPPPFYYTGTEVSNMSREIVNREYEVAVYYFPQWHPDPQNEERRGKGWSEWLTLREAKPRFEGHDQPKVPMWGELDESKPEVAEKQIAAAADHGITTFIYDWYFDLNGPGTGPFLHRALEEGFLRASNRHCLNFSLMWANHNEISRERFDALADYVIEKYFGEPNYWIVNGGLYFSIYELHTFIKGLGGVDAARDALQSFRRKTLSAGFPGLHLNAVEWGLKGSRLARITEDTDALVRQLGFDSVTSYVWAHNIELEEFPSAPYDKWAAEAVKLWPVFRDQYDVPYYPNVSMGWDPSPRTDPDKEYVRGAYPYDTIIVGNTPERFREALARVKEFLDEGKTQPKIFTIYAWNEWTEGGYLEPDTVNGMGYLEAIRDVFGSD